MEVAREQAKGQEGKKVVVFYTVCQEGRPGLENPRSAKVIRAMQDQGIRAQVLHSTNLIQAIFWITSVIPIPLFDDNVRGYWSPRPRSSALVPTWARFSPWAIGIGSRCVSKSRRIEDTGRQLHSSWTKWSRNGNGNGHVRVAEAPESNGSTPSINGHHYPWGLPRTSKRKRRRRLPRRERYAHFIH